MKLNVYVIRNKKLKCTGQPYFDDHEPDVFATSFERMLLTAPEEKVFQYENCSLWHLATYDDETMVLKPVECIQLLDCSQVLEDRGVQRSIIEKFKTESEINKEEVEEFLKM